MTDKTSVFQVRIETDLLEKLDEKCKNEHRNRSETIRMLIQNYLKES